MRFQRLVILSLTSTSLQGFQITARRPFVRSLATVFSSSTACLMSTSADNVGQADIGQEASSASTSYPTEGSSWRTLLEVASNRSRKIRGSNYVQLATVEDNGVPRNRCVVFRGFQKLPDDHALASTLDGLSCVMKMITDQRSKKVEQIAKQPLAEMVWWFPKTSEQFRVSGEIVFVGAGPFPHDGDKTLQTIRKEMWGNISESSRESFLLDHVPGESFVEPNTPPAGGRDPDGKVLPPPDNFLLMLLIPRDVDYLRLTNMYRQVDRLENGEWTSLRVNP